MGTHDRCLPVVAGSPQTDGDIQWLKQSSTARLSPAGDRVFREGDPANQAYLLQKGRIEIVKSIDGAEVVLGSVGEGAILGDMGLIDDAPRMASAVAVESTTVLVITRAIFEEKLAKTDPFIRRLLRIFVDNIRNLSAKQQSAPLPLATKTDPDQAPTTVKPTPAKTKA
ncbi:MAG: cyclic nucleotide-binding domain-containing protein [Rhodospirillales bacterium]|nr:cyclic nucleotide-binding domain-containing protein [Rhodospirillales bacterium]